MAYRIYLDTFSSLDDIPKKDRSKPAVLLEFFQKSNCRRVSTFEMTQPIWNALKKLEADGKLEFVESGYPWHAFKLLPCSTATKCEGQS
jgi:hypothetical protein